MENIWFVLLATFISGCIGTGLGGLFGSLFKKDSKKVVSLLLSFAAGVMLAIVCFDLLKEAINPVKGQDPNVGNIFLVIGFTILGFLIVFLLNVLIDKKLKKEVPHTSDKEHPTVHDDLDEMIHADHLEHHKKTGSSLFGAGLVMAIVIALHNIPEGMVIGASFAKEAFDGGKVIASGAGALTALVIALHNIPEGMAVAVPLIAGGTKKWKAVLITFLCGIPTVIGALIGFLAGMINPIALSISLALASGAMLYIIFGELLPESMIITKSKWPAIFLFGGLMIGLAVISIPMGL